MINEFDLKNEMEIEIYNKFLDNYRTDKESNIYNKIIAKECELKHSLNKFQLLIYEKIVDLKNDLYLLENLRLIKFVMRKYDEFKNLDSSTDSMWQRKMISKA